MLSTPVAPSDTSIDRELHTSQVGSRFQAYRLRPRYARIVRPRLGLLRRTGLTPGGPIKSRIKSGAVAPPGPRH